MFHEISDVHIVVKKVKNKFIIPIVIVVRSLLLLLLLHIHLLLLI